MARQCTKTELSIMEIIYKGQQDVQSASTLRREDFTSYFFTRENLLEHYNGEAYITPKPVNQGELFLGLYVGEKDSKTTYSFILNLEGNTIRNERFTWASFMQATFQSILLAMDFHGVDYTPFTEKYSIPLDVEAL